MSKQDKIEMRNFAIMLNMAMGVYNLYLFTIYGSLFNLVVGSLNLGVFIFLRHKLHKIAN